MQTFNYSEQDKYVNSVKESVLTYFGHKPAACIITYGCQQNVSDSERIKGMLDGMGFSICDEPGKADFLLYNTCAVREHAEDRVYGNVGATKNLKRKNPKLIVAVSGCMAQQKSVSDRIRASYRYVDILFGTHVQYRLPEFLYRFMNTGERVFDISENNGIAEGVPVKRDGDFKGWLSVMNGCNNFCTYCIVPYVRGRERSRDPEAILREAEEMVKLGYKDITLLGQNVNSYGKGESHGVNFAKLLRMINAIPGDFRIRFMTSHPKDCTEELLTAMRDCEKVCRHIHLPVQSGSDRILKKMNRHYDRDTYLSLIKKAKELMPDISVTSDIIVGFPGETYEDFKDTLSLVKEIKYSALFTFIFSPREGTPAAGMEDPISREEKGRWFSELLKVQDEIGKKNAEECVGKTFRLLCDGAGRKEGLMSGHTGGTQVIEFEGDESMIGKFLTVKVNSLSSVLEGTVIKEN